MMAQSRQLLIIFSSAVFRENPDVLLLPSVVVHVVQKLREFVISLLLLKILKLGVCVHYPKSNLYYQGRQFKMHFFFFSKLCPFFDLNILSSIKLNINTLGPAMFEHCSPLIGEGCILVPPPPPPHPKLLYSTDDLIIVSKMATRKV